MKRYAISLLLVLLLALVLIAPVAAQEVTPQALPDTSTEVTVENGGTVIINPAAEPESVLEDASTDITVAFESLLKFVTDLTFLPFAVGFVVVATALLKKVIPEGLVGPGVIALVLQVVVWVVYIILKERFGVTEQAFRSVLDALTTVLSGVSMFVIGAGVSQKAYDALRRNDVPLVGQAQPQSLQSTKG